HSSLYTWPGENAVIYSWGHMGTGGMEKLSIQDGQLVFTEDFYQETEWNEESLDYTDPALFVPGSEYIPSYYTGNLWRPPETPGQILPVYRYGTSPREMTTPMDEGVVRAAIGKVLWEGESLFGVSGDGFHGDTGRVTLEEYLQPGVAYPYNDEPFIVSEYAWADVNGDGQLDCILRLGDWTYTVFSVWEDTVYGYFFDLYRDTMILGPDGRAYFVSDNSYYWWQTDFYCNQCNKWLISSLGEMADLPWEKFN
ncbi:MAG: hypothetical protein J6J87_00995, partial [Oscillospiraceae bacterium]|nr:hypothetical protein [Oscillospiraceae bacterium]